MNRCINEAARYVARDTTCMGAEYSASSVADQRDYTLPAAYMPPLTGVEWDYGGTSEYALPYLPPDYCSYYNSTGAGTPVAFTLIVNGPYLVVRLLPKPSETAKVIHVRCAKVPDVLSSDEGITEMPLDSHDAIIAYATYLAWDRWEEATNADRAAMQYQAIAATLRLRWTAPAGYYPLGEPGVGPTAVPSAMPPEYP